LTNNIDRLEVGQGHYTFLLKDNGGIIDDLIVYRTKPTEFLLVVNASRTDEDYAWLKSHLTENISLRDQSADYGGLAIQGPHVNDLLRAVLGPETPLPARNEIFQLTNDKKQLLIARTGYTGEDGVEVFLAANNVSEFWNILLEKGKALGVKPCGLGARDTLRLEMCYPLNGSDLSPDRNPIEAGLAFFVDLQKPKFVGREPLAQAKEQGTAVRLAAFRMKEKGPPPRPHYKVWAGQDQIGETTSGTLSPSLNQGIGLAYLPTQHTKIGTEIEIEIRGQRFPAIIEKKPLYKKL
jgi:aminomethyltransferase